MIAPIAKCMDATCATIAPLSTVEELGAICALMVLCVLVTLVVLLWLDSSLARHLCMHWLSESAMCGRCLDKADARHHDRLFERAGARRGPAADGIDFKGRNANGN